VGKKYEKEIEEIIDRSNDSNISKRKPPINYYWRGLTSKYPRLLQAILLVFVVFLSSAFIGIEFSLITSILFLLFLYGFQKYQKHQATHKYKKKWRGKEVD
jgi:hypothetical protein|tara:strand:+ start:3186 stop:3488 length:303 start_codon:yes stop_codon:yes gene_type:complete